MTKQPHKNGISNPDDLIKQKKPVVIPHAQDKAKNKITQDIKHNSQVHNNHLGNQGHGRKNNSNSKNS